MKPWQEWLDQNDVKYSVIVAYVAMSVADDYHPSWGAVGWSLIAGFAMLVACLVLENLPLGGKKVL